MSGHIYEDGYVNPYQRGSEKKIIYTIENGCWINTSHHKNNKGYADIKRDGYRTKLHRYIFEHHNGIKLSSEDIIMHTCDNPACINPEHLVRGTIDENNKDKTKKGRQTKGESIHTATLTEEDVRNILKDPRSGNQLAKEYGVHRSTINSIRRGETWKHVTLL
ncbi:hypothetical protein JL_60 [Bacillus phage JL]|uniref:HNH nuclease domain-containing protein n=1 Tax=Bacillus phage JL TaxID=1296655 RepID=S5M4F5_9CAUD|nr:endonuclease [Bacillus phage JL]AGR46746.1 hypothetical protein JL_60 [Bacillus phage JL]